MAKSAPEHPSVQTLLGSPDAVVLKVAEQVYSRELAVVPSVLSHKQQDRCMRELCQELAGHMARASLQSEVGLPGPSSRDQRCSHSCSISQACSPQLDLRGQE